ncbi:VOC family protein [Nonomuraea maritima]|uniref:VOC family protein n=1 Tax=Nonomuraea maritima TaxID=683260 RepID=UPI0037177C88
MTSQLHALCWDAHDPARLASFWAGLLGWESTDDSGGGVAILPNDDTGFRIRFLATHEPKTRMNQMHFDLTSTSLDDQQQTVARALELGGRHFDVGQGPEVRHVVLADPEGNEFCVIESDNKFLAECGFVGALASDGSQEVGYFWSAALDWPLVWDQDQETAIRSPHGGPKITWGGPPFAPKTGKNRLHYDLAPDGDQQTEVDRLVSLGAKRIDPTHGEPGSVAMADPDGNEFCVMAPR